MKLKSGGGHDTIRDINTTFLWPTPKSSKNVRKEFLMDASLKKYVLSDVKIWTKMTST